MSYADLYAAHHPEVRAFARRLLRDEAEADDVAAATFEVLPRALENYKATAEIRSFVLGICANLARRATRSLTRRRRAIERLAHESIETHAEDPEATAVRKELVARIAEALESLPEEQRMAFVMVGIEERSTAEVARLCGVPEATVRTRLFHARRKLREALTRPQQPAFPRVLASCAAVLLAFALGGTAYAAATHFDAIRSWVRRVVGIEHPAPPVRAPVSSHAPAARNPEPDPRRESLSHASAISPTTLPAASAISPTTLPAASAISPTQHDDEPLALFERAHRLHFGARRYAEALRAWEAYLAIAPRGRLALEARYNRGIALARLGRLVEARRALAPFAEGVHGSYRRDDAAVLVRAIDRASAER